MGALATGIKEIFATAKTTCTNVMICTANGTPDGHITMPNITSVLGSTFTNITSGMDLNNCTNIGIYICQSVTVTQSLSNCPVTTAFYMLNIYGHAGSIVYQILINSGTSSAATYIRQCGISDSSLTQSWHKYNIDIPDFYKDYQTLAALATALGVPNKGSKPSSVTHADNLTSTGFYSIGSALDGGPNGIGYAIWLVFDGGAYKAQFVMSPYGFDVRWYLSSWSVWRRISFTS